MRKDYAGLITRVRVRGDKVSRSRENDSWVNPLFGHLEGSISVSGTKGKGRLDKLGDAALNTAHNPVVERTFTYDISSTQTPDSLYPYRTFRPGDWVLVPSESGPLRMRVSQVAITKDTDQTTVTVTVGDMIPSGAAAMARRLKQQSLGSKPGGTMESVNPVPNTVPAAPTSLAASPLGYWDAAGVAKTKVVLTWDAVSLSIDGTDLDE